MSIFDKIRALLDKAESTTFEGEAATYRAKAEELMRKYQVEEEQLIAKDPQVLVPTNRSMKVTDSREFGNQYFSMLWFVAKHMGVELRGSWVYDPELRGSVVQATLVGYESDMRMVDVLFTSARMAFSDHLEPAVDPTLTDQVNCYRMRRAGLERNKIARLLWNSADDDGKAHGRVSALYKAECEARSEKPALSGRGVNAKLYRKEYADAFVQRMWHRLKKARDAADRQGGLPQLAGREERVKEAFYALFPEERPVPTTATTAVTEKPRKAKPHRVTKKELRDYERRNRPEVWAARGAGTSAADTVKIDGSENTVRLEEGTSTWSERAFDELGM